jgi:hypothetical protein
MDSGMASSVIIVDINRAALDYRQQQADAGVIFLTRGIFKEF